MKHPRVWAVVLILVSVPALVLGAGLAFTCYIPSPSGCFAPLDATLGFSMLIVGGLPIIGAAMLLTTAASHRVRAPGER